jgi:hypothetical protein
MKSTCNAAHICARRIALELYLRIFCYRSVSLICHKDTFVGFAIIILIRYNHLLYPNSFCQFLTHPLQVDRYKMKQSETGLKNPG